MKEKWLEDSLYDRLGTKEERVDLDDLWTELESKRFPRKKKRRLLFWWLFPFILLISGMFFTRFYIGDKPKNEDKLIDTARKEEELIAGSEKQNQEKFLLPTKIEKGKIEKDSSASQNIKLSQRETGTVKVLKFPETSIAYRTVNQLLSEPTFKEHKPNGPLKAVSKAATNPSLFSEVSSHDTPKNEQKALLSEFTPIKTIPFMVLDYYRDLPLSSFVSLVKREKLFSKEFLVLGSYGNMSIQQEVPEVGLDKYELGVAYRNYFSPSFYIQTGLGLQQYTTRMESEREALKSTTEIDTAVIIYHQGIIVDVQLDSLSTEHVDTYLDVRYQKFRTLRIPILLGYNYELSERFSINASGGFSFNIINMYNGTFRQMDEELIVDNNTFRKIGNIDFISGLSLRMRLSNTWTLNLGGSLNLDLRNRLNKNGSNNESRRFRSINASIVIGKLF